MTISFYKRDRDGVKTRERKVCFCLREKKKVKGSWSVSCFGSCSEWNMSLPNVVIDWWLRDRWTHKEHFAREVPLNAQRLTLTFHWTTYIKWSIVLPLSNQAPCLRNRSTALQGQNSSEEKWADLSPWTLFWQWFILRPNHGPVRAFWQDMFNTSIVQHVFIIRHNFAYIPPQSESLETHRLWETGVWALTCFYLDRMSSKIKTVC